MPQPKGKDWLNGYKNMIPEGLEKDIPCKYRPKEMTLK